MHLTYVMSGKNVTHTLSQKKICERRRKCLYNDDQVSDDCQLTSQDCVINSKTDDGYGR